MKTRWLRLGLAGLVVFLFSLVSQFPAAPVLASLRDVSGSAIRWQSVTGDIFDLTLNRLELPLPDGRRPVIDRLHLELSALGLLRGQLSFLITAETFGGILTTELVLGLQRWSLRDLEAEFSLQGFYPVVPEFQLSGIEGELMVQARLFAGRYNDWPDTGEMEMGISELTVALLAPGQALGDYHINLQAIGDSMLNGRINSTTREAQLQLDADLILDGARNILNIRGQGEIASTSPDSLRDILPLLGQASGRKVDINWQQQLRRTSP